MTKTYDLVVIGGGTAALIAALGGAGVGARVALIERHRVGGDCLWTGCVPSKALIAAAATAHTMSSASRHGIDPVSPVVDLARVMASVRAAQRIIEPHDSPDRLREVGVEVFTGHGRFTGHGTIEVDGSDGNTSQLRYRRALVATGSRPVVPHIDGLDAAAPLTSDTVWDLEVLPTRLVLLGGGPIGCELGQSFARLGSKVTIVESMPHLLPREADRVAAALTERLAGEGIEVRTSTTATRVDITDNGAGFELMVMSNGVESTIPFDNILVSVGRRPTTADLGLDAIGARVDERGYVVVDDMLRTTADNVFAAGDVTGVMPFTHVAAYQARIVVTNALFSMRRRASYDHIPAVTFTAPEVARVGLDEPGARQRWGSRAVVQRFDYATLDRAVANGDAFGYAELIGDPKGRIVGATVIGDAAGETIAEMTAWIASGAKIATVSQTVHAYPTFAEGPSRAADELLRAKYFSPQMRRISAIALGVSRRVDRFMRRGG
ncbi:MAG: NAD(P)/FAD-dependent oxidoreductase [Acidimicrobiia bacterium]